MKSRATARFWECYHQLPRDAQRTAVRAYSFWKSDPTHPSLNFKKLQGGGNRFSIRVGIHYRAIGHRVGDGVEWVWIGSHGDYDHLLRYPASRS
ncbi:MAG: hypothetical protein ACOYMV_12780 [Verrucomicrobiia bacterium]